MQQPYEAAFATLDREKTTLLRSLEDWDEERLFDRPAPDQWSAIEVVEHLRKTEFAALESCRTHLKESSHIVSRQERVKAVLLDCMMRLPVRVTVPAEARFVLPGRPTSRKTVLAAWASERLQLKEFLDCVPESLKDYGAMRHPVIGWMTVRSALAFLSAHLRHHQFQIRRIARALSL